MSLLKSPVTQGRSGRTEKPKPATEEKLKGVLDQFVKTFA